MFYTLVAKHHKKLYAPSDYKNESNFVRTYNNFTRTEELIKETELEKQQCQDLSQAPVGMSQKDIEFLKETLNSVVSIQKQLAAQPQKNTSIEIVEKAEQEVNKLIDDYVVVKKSFLRYKVEISPIKNCYGLMEVLQDRGYDASIYTMAFISDDFESQHTQHEAIWLGCNVPVDMAVDVIKLAKSFFPHLKYIELSNTDRFVPDEVHNQIYIGGASSTARERNLKTLTSADFEKLYTMKDISELHSFVCSFS